MDESKALNLLYTPPAELVGQAFLVHTKGMPPNEPPDWGLFTRVAEGEAGTTLTLLTLTQPNSQQLATDIFPPMLLEQNTPQHWAENYTFFPISAHNADKIRKLMRLMWQDFAQEVWAALNNGADMAKVKGFPTLGKP